MTNGRRLTRSARHKMIAGVCGGLAEYFDLDPTLGGSGPNFRDATRRFRDALLAKGYVVTYTEVPGAQHRPEDWKLRLPVGIVSLTSHWERDGSTR